MKDRFGRWHLSPTLWIPLLILGQLLVYFDSVKVFYYLVIFVMSALLGYLSAEIYRTIRGK